MSDPQVLKSAEQFFFDIPLYETVTLEAEASGLITQIVKDIYGHGSKIDGYCHQCRREVTFSVTSHTGINDLKPFKNRHYLEKTTLSCDRDRSHQIYYNWMSEDGTLQKYGQLPSLATITNAELAQYRSLMSKEDAQEFYKAVGLSAHGIGIGSFVYLRRVFERLINERFKEFATSEGWSEEDFRKLRMNEKIQHLKSHLPEFLVTNSRVYSILSIGIHQLDEQQCLAFFELMKDSIIVILEDDQKKMEEVKRRQSLSQAISGIDFESIEAGDQ